MSIYGQPMGATVFIIGSDGQIIIIIIITVHIKVANWQFHFTRKDSCTRYQWNRTVRCTSKFACKYFVWLNLHTQTVYTSKLQSVQKNVTYESSLIYLAICQEIKASKFISLKRFYKLYSNTSTVDTVTNITTLHVPLSVSSLWLSPHFHTNTYMATQTVCM